MKEEQDVHFYKKGIQTAETGKEEDRKRTWIKKTPPFQINKTPLYTLDSFELVRNLGSGKYGKVFLAR